MNLCTIEKERLRKIETTVIEWSQGGSSIDSIISLTKWKFGERIAPEQVKSILNEGIK